MPLATSAETDAHAYALASFSGMTPDEAVASALRAELERKQAAAGLQPTPQPELTVEELLAKIRSYGPWQGPTSAELAAELYDAEGLPR